MTLQLIKILVCAYFHHKYRKLNEKGGVMHQVEFEWPYQKIQIQYDKLFIDTKLQKQEFIHSSITKILIYFHDLYESCLLIFFFTFFLPAYSSVLTQE